MDIGVFAVSSYAKGYKIVVKEPRGQELIDRYKKNYNIPVDAEITEEMILAHWELEKRLTKELLESNPENRWEVFEKCYSRLYGELEWLNRLVHAATTSPPSQRYEGWLYFIGQSPKRIYEVGAGKGELIAYLASCGFECKATEITHQRGQKHVSVHRNLSWGITDGVHLERFEAPNSYDIVISNQVIEHLHPDDLYEHFKGVLSILSSGGRYIFASPHRFVGPSDISGVLKCDKPMGMHLKEYTYRELTKLLAGAGFEGIYGNLSIPIRVGNLCRQPVEARASRIYLVYLCVLEKFISLLPRQAFRRKAVELLLTVSLFSPSIFVTSRKK